MGELRAVSLHRVVTPAYDRSNRDSRDQLAWFLWDAPTGLSLSFGIFLFAMVRFFLGVSFCAGEVSSPFWLPQKGNASESDSTAISCPGHLSRCKSENSIVTPHLAYRKFASPFGNPWWISPKRYEQKAVSLVGIICILQKFTFRCLPRENFSHFLNAME